METNEAKYISSIGWRTETKHSMLRRMEEHNYHSSGIYMITLTLHNRSFPLLGKLQWSHNPDGGQQAIIIPSELGKLVEREWRLITNDYPQIEIIRVQLMEEHLHAILYIRAEIPCHLGNIIGKIKNRCNKHYWQQLTRQGLLGPKGEDAPPPLFSKNFQDTVLYGKGQLEAMIRYVSENPLRALTKRENPEMFKVVHSLTINGTTFAAIGNRWLLNKPIRMQVKCHNNTSSENQLLISKQKEYFLMRGTKGGVVVSPCISAGEREIARAALDAHQPLIVILENGFAPLYKPPGKYFTACAEGQLLMLAPWPYHMERRTITRTQCLQLNAMAANVSTEPWTEEMEERMKRGEDIEEPEAEAENKGQRESES